MATIFVVVIILFYLLFTSTCFDRVFGRPFQCMGLMFTVYGEMAIISTEWKYLLNKMNHTIADGMQLPAIITYHHQRKSFLLFASIFVHHQQIGSKLFIFTKRPRQINNKN